MSKPGSYFSEEVTVNVTGGEYTGVQRVWDREELWLIVSTKVEEEKVPETGDNGSWVLWTAVSVISVCALVSLSVLRRKNSVI